MCRPIENARAMRGATRKNALREGNLAASLQWTTQNVHDDDVNVRQRHHAMVVIFNNPGTWVGGVAVARTTTCERSESEGARLRILNGRRAAARRFSRRLQATYEPPTCRLRAAYVPLIFCYVPLRAESEDSRFRTLRGRHVAARSKTYAARRRHVGGT